MDAHIPALAGDSEPSVRKNPILAEHAAAIRALGKRVVRDVIEIGERLTECKRVAGHGHWLPWLDQEFGWTDETAYRFIRVAELSKQIPQIVDFDLPLSGLYLLAAPSTPETAKTEILERVQTGEPVPVAEVKRVVERHKPPSRKPPKAKPAKAADSSSPPSTEALQQRAAAAEQPRGLSGKPEPPLRDDVGPNSAAEAARLRARVEELQAQVCQRDIKIARLERELEELRARLATAGSGDMSISEFQAAIKKWEETVETQRGIIATLESENASLRAAKRELDEIIAAQADDDALPPADDGAPCDGEDADLVDAYAQRGCNDTEVPDIPEPGPLPTTAAPPADPRDPGPFPAFLLRSAS
jgi:hypothetical protein